MNKEKQAGIDDKNKKQQQEVLDRRLGNKPITENEKNIIDGKIAVLDEALKAAGRDNKMFRDQLVNKKNKIVLENAKLKNKVMTGGAGKLQLARSMSTINMTEIRSIDRDDRSNQSGSFWGSMVKGFKMPGKHKTQPLDNTLGFTMIKDEESQQFSANHGKVIDIWGKPLGTSDVGIGVDSSIKFGGPESQIFEKELSAVADGGADVNIKGDGPVGLMNITEAQNESEISDKDQSQSVINKTDILGPIKEENPNPDGKNDDDDPDALEKGNFVPLNMGNRTLGGDLTNKSIGEMKKEKQTEENLFNEILGGDAAPPKMVMLDESIIANANDQSQMPLKDGEDPIQGSPDAENPQSQKGSQIDPSILDASNAIRSSLAPGSNLSDSNLGLSKYIELFNAKEKEFAEREVARQLDLRDQGMEDDIETYDETVDALAQIDLEMTPDQLVSLKEAFDGSDLKLLPNQCKDLINSCVGRAGRLDKIIEIIVECKNFRLDNFKDRREDLLWQFQSPIKIFMICHSMLGIIKAYPTFTSPLYLRGLYLMAQMATYLTLPLMIFSIVHPFFITIPYGKDDEKEMYGIIYDIGDIRNIIITIVASLIAPI